MVTRTRSSDLRFSRRQNLFPSKFKTFLRLVSLAFALMTATVSCDAKSSVSLNLLNPDRSQDDLLRPYMFNLRQRIESNWRLDQKAERASKVYFQIGSSGEMATVRVESSSGNTSVDRCSVRAISGCAPFAPPPPTSEGTLKIVATFRNSQKTVDPNAVNPDFVVHVEQGAYSKHKFQNEGGAQRQQSEGHVDEWHEETSPFASPKAEVAQAFSNSINEQSQPNLNSKYQLSSTNTTSRQPSKVALATPSVARGRWNPKYKRKLEPWEEELLRSRSEFGSSPPAQPKQAKPNSLPQPRSAKLPTQMSPQTRVLVTKPATKKVVGYMQPTKKPIAIKKPNIASISPPADSLPPISPSQATNLMATPLAVPSTPIQLEPAEPQISDFAVGQEKNGFPWWILITAGLVGATAYGISAAGRQPCPFFAETIKKAAIVCRHCNATLKETVNEMTSS